MKKLDPVTEVENYKAELHERINRWNNIIANGCSDPTWPDGINLNLVRNHIIITTRRINELCDEYGLIKPEESCCVPPPEVDQNLWTGERSGPRYERLSKYPGHELVYLEEPIVYEPFPETQMSLF